MEALRQGLPLSTLTDANVTINIIGCGEAVCIPEYVKETSCPYPIHADPSVRSYAVLGMMRTIRESKIKPAYIKKGFWENALGSALGQLTNPNVLKGGPSAQNGGERLFQGGELKWCHRMRNATDHTEVEELRALLGIKD